MLRFLLDTNIISELQRPNPNRGVVDRVERDHHQSAISTITWHELNFGCDRLPPSNRRNQLRSYLAQIAETLPILPYDQAAAYWHAQERSRLARLGLTPAFADGQIAVIATTCQLVLVTRNLQDFQNFNNLTLENWFD
ncbi:MAG: type II toxin-antitoxin system VapC family toxin [Limnothrix sp. BL-A-16]